MRQRLTISIAELVLHGFQPGERHAVADAIARTIEAELGGRIARTPAAAERVDAGRVSIAHADRRAGEPIGRAVANAIYPRGSADPRGPARGGR